MFKNFIGLTDLQIFKRTRDVDQWEPCYENSGLEIALSELFEQNGFDPIDMNLIYHGNADASGIIFLNSGYLRNGTFDASKTDAWDEYRNTQLRTIGSNRYSFYFYGEESKHKISKTLNIFATDGEKVDALLPLDPDQKIADALAQSLAGMVHDDLHGRYQLRPTQFLDTRRKIKSTYYKLFHEIFRGTSHFDQVLAYEAFVIGLHAARLKFTPTGKHIYQEHIDDLSYTFEVCANFQDLAIQQHHDHQIAFPLLDGIQYMKSMAMRSAWHLMLSDEKTYQDLAAQSNLHWQQVVSTKMGRAAHEKGLCPSFDEHFLDAHLAMGIELGHGGHITFEEETFTPVQLIHRMHRDAQFASRIAWDLLSAQEQDHKIRAKFTYIPGLHHKTRTHMVPAPAA